MECREERVEVGGERVSMCKRISEAKSTVRISRQEDPSPYGCGDSCKESSWGAERKSESTLFRDCPSRERVRPALVPIRSPSEHLKRICLTVDPEDAGK